jgi:hypothetical protein
MPEYITTPGTFHGPTGEGSSPAPNMAPFVRSDHEALRNLDTLQLLDILSDIDRRIAREGGGGYGGIYYLVAGDCRAIIMERANVPPD